MLKLAIVKMVLALWELIAVGLSRQPQAPAIAEAIADAVIEDGASAPIYSSHAEDAAALAFGAFRESSLVPRPGDCTPDGRCEAHGAWQLHGPCGHAPLHAQARCWLELLKASDCPRKLAVLWGQCSGKVPTGDGRTASVERLAAQRERRARELLRGVLAAGD